MAKRKIRLYFCYTKFEKEVMVKIKHVYTVVTWHMAYFGHYKASTERNSAAPKVNF